MTDSLMDHVWSITDPSWILHDSATALEYQMLLLIATAEDVEVDRHDVNVGLSHETFLARLRLAEQHLLGLIHVAQADLPAPTEALFRAVWEGLLKAVHSLYRTARENAATLVEHFEATLEANASKGLARPRVKDQRIPVGRFLDDLKKINPEIAQTFETAKTLFYDSSCGFLHGDLGGALGARVRQTRHGLPDQQRAAYGSTFLWASLLVSATMDALAQRFAIEENVLQGMKAEGGAVVAALLDQEE